MVRPQHRDLMRCVVGDVRKHQLLMLAIVRWFHFRGGDGAKGLVTQKLNS